jgi:hypothetical protein
MSSTDYKINFELWFDTHYTDKRGDPMPKHPRIIRENLGWGIQDFYFHHAIDGNPGIDVSAWIFKEDCEFLVDLCDALIITEDEEVAKASQQQ